jgi:Spy/CpxP family protein refolding chaperone
MKKIVLSFLVAGIALSFSATAAAQAAGPAGGHGKKEGGKGGPGGMRARQHKMQQEMFTKLNLNADQKKKVTALTEARREKMKALMEELRASGGDRQANREKFMAIQKSFHDDLMKILNPEQETKFKALRKEMMEKRREARKKNKPGPVTPL